MSTGSFPKCIPFVPLLTESRENRLVTVREMLINLKSLFDNGERNRKVIRNPYSVPDHHQKLTTSRRPPSAHGYHVNVWLTSVTAIVSYPAHRTTE